MEREMALVSSDVKKEKDAKPKKGGMGHAHLVTAEDRAFVTKEHAGRGAVMSRTWSSSSNTSPGGKPGGQHPKSKFLKAETQTANAPLVKAGIVTVQEDGAVMKEWSGMRGGDSNDHFKSPSLFWEIRLKESKVKATELEKQSKQSSVFQIIEACDMLNQFTGRDAANIDPAVLEQVKEQIFMGLFADYAQQSKRGGFKSKLQMLQACVPYYVIAERQFSDNQRISVRLSELEKQFQDEPKAKSFTSSGTQTATEELNKTSGVNALREHIDQLQAIITDLNAERFAIKLQADEAIGAAHGDNQNLRDQLERISARSDAVMSEAEIIRADAEVMKDRNAKLETENKQVWERSQDLDRKLLNLTREYKDWSAQMSYTLDTERRRFKQERSWWLDSFVTERYEWLNALESTQQQVDKDAREAQAKKSKKKKKKEQEEKDADRATLWQALTELEQSSREHLESLYWEEDTIKIKDQAEYTKKVRGALQEQAAQLESLLLDSQCVKKWDQEAGLLQS